MYTGTSIYTGTEYHRFSARLDYLVAIQMIYRNGMVLADDAAPFYWE
jgi:hypothetical protein